LRAKADPQRRSAPSTPLPRSRLRLGPGGVCPWPGKPSIDPSADGAFSGYPSDNPKRHLGAILRWHSSASSGRCWMLQANGLRALPEVRLEHLHLGRYRAAFHVCDGLFFWRCRKRTPGPPPFSSMNSTPAPSKARRIARSLADVIEVSRPASSARRIVRKLTADRRARSAAVQPISALAALI
jgi:hypothetical protein